MGAMIVILYTFLIFAGCLIVRAVVQRKWQLDGASWAAVTVLLIFLCFGIGVEIARPLNSLAQKIAISILAITVATSAMIGVAGYWHAKHTQHPKH